MVPVSLVAIVHAGESVGKRLRQCECGLFPSRGSLSNIGLRPFDVLGDLGAT
jgi:hypothetical protein